jgi:hypothetical protein
MSKPKWKEVVQETREVRKLAEKIAERALHEEDDEVLSDLLLWCQDARQTLEQALEEPDAAGV